MNIEYIEIPLPVVRLYILSKTLVSYTMVIIQEQRASTKLIPQSLKRIEIDRLLFYTCDKVEYFGVQCSIYSDNYFPST